MQRISPEDRVLDFFLTADLAVAVSTLNIVKRVIYNRQQRDLAPVGVSFKVPAKPKRTKAGMETATTQETQKGE